MDQDDQLLGQVDIHGRPAGDQVAVRQRRGHDGAVVLVFAGAQRQAFARAFLGHGDQQLVVELGLAGAEDDHRQTRGAQHGTQRLARGLAPVMRLPALSVGVSWSTIKSAPAASAALAQAAGSSARRPRPARAARATLQPGLPARTSMATRGRCGILPSKPRKGSVVAPPTVTVWLRVPPSAAVAPSVIWRTLPDHFSTGTSTFTGIENLLCVNAIDCR